jgi:hypothetical protein
MDKRASKLCAAALLCFATACSAFRLKGFDISPYWDEQILWTTLAPGDVTLHINAPADALLNPALPTRLTLFALPNGNTINMTAGKATPDESVDWHYGIQSTTCCARPVSLSLVPCRHWSADASPARSESQHQLRDGCAFGSAPCCWQRGFLMFLLGLCAGYLANDLLSWPAWRTKHADWATLVPKIVQQGPFSCRRMRDRVTGVGSSIGLFSLCAAMQQVAVLNATLALSSHSGGGAFLFSYMNGTAPDIAVAQRLS